MTMEELRMKLLEYDREMGEYPENPREGFAFWEWLNKTEHVDRVAESEAYYAWMKEIGPRDED